MQCRYKLCLCCLHYRFSLRNGVTYAVVVYVVVVSSLLDNVTSASGYEEAATPVPDRQLASALSNTTAAPPATFANSATVNESTINELPEMQLAIAIERHSSGILLVVGIVGNALSVAVMTRRRMRTTTASVYLVSLACVDTAVLLLAMVPLWLLRHYGAGALVFSAVGCRAYGLALYTSRHLQSWILVFFTLERLVAVLLPHHARRLLSRSRAAVMIGSAALVLTALNLHLLWTMDLVSDWADGRRRCGANADYWHFMLHALPFIDIAVMSLVPSVVLIGANTAIAVSLHRRRVRHRDHCTTTAAAHHTPALILATITVAFIVTTTPKSVFIAVQNIWLMPIITVGAAARMRLAHVALAALMYTNNVLNFFLYCLSARSFRRELYVMFGGGGGEAGAIIGSSGHQSVQLTAVHSDLPQ